MRPASAVGSRRGAGRSGGPSSPAPFQANHEGGLGRALPSRAPVDCARGMPVPNVHGAGRFILPRPAATSRWSLALAPPQEGAHVNHRLVPLLLAAAILAPRTASAFASIEGFYG